MQSLDESLHWMPKSVSLQRKIANDIKSDEVVMICIKNKVNELLTTFHRSL
ncbi:hypothetical protein N3930_45830 [Bacillus thuringiensis]|nr:hypothetical protein [Bacillus thuringiensis]